MFEKQNKTRRSKKKKTKEIKIVKTDRENRFCYFSIPPPEAIRVTGTSFRLSKIFGIV